MQIQIQSTDKITSIDGVPVRFWEGITESGIPCNVFVYRINVDDSEDQSAFEADLQEESIPSELKDILNSETRRVRGYKAL